MKSLLKKDYYLIRYQLAIIVAVYFAICPVLSFFHIHPMFPVSLFIGAGMSVSVQTFQIDQVNNLHPYGLSLPFGKKKYVGSKYALLIVNSIVFYCVGLVGIVIFFQMNTIVWKELLLASFYIIFIFWFAFFIALPSYFKKGYREDSRFFQLIYMLFLTAYQLTGWDVSDFTISSKTILNYTIAAITILIISFIFSYNISIELLKEK